MRKTKSAVSAMVLAVAAIGINAFVPTQNTNDTTSQTVENEVMEDVEYTGVTLLSSALIDVLGEGLNNEDSSVSTGKTVSYSVGLSAALDEYSTNVSNDEASLEALDIATKLVPEGSIIEGYTNLGVSDVDSYLNIRKEAGTDKKVIGKMPGGSACEILDEADGWYKIKSGDVTGYVCADYILTGYLANVKAQETMKRELLVTCDVLNVRQEASTNCTVATSVANGEHLEILEDASNGWYKVNINNLVGYVSADYVKEVYSLPVAVEIVEVQANTNAGTASSGGSVYTGPTFDTSTLDQNVSQTAKDLIEYAMQFLGNPYVYGGNSLTNGTDCSGFTKLIFAQFGYDLPRSSSAYIGVGTQIPYTSAKPGDILVYKYGDSIGHVAIYIGNGQIVHASTPSGGIRIGGAYYTTPYCAVRVIP